MLVVNWMNGRWPCHSPYYQSEIAVAQKRFHIWHQQGAAPRKRYLDWCRHLPRELNKHADALATKGKLLTDEEDVIDKMYMIDPNKNYYIRGFWDGGYKPGDLFCGIGVHLEVNEFLPQQKPNGWRLALQIYGKRQGRSAVAAEVEAAKVLTQALHCLISNHVIQFS